MVKNNPAVKLDTIRDVRVWINEFIISFTPVNGVVRLIEMLIEILPSVSPL